MNERTRKILDMTNEEAADVLRHMLITYNPPRGNGKAESNMRLIVALNKAIHALEIGPDADEEEAMDDRDKIIAFLAGLIRDLIYDNNFTSVTSDELQALDNIIDDLPEVDAKEFRW